MLIVSILIKYVGKIEQLFSGKLGSVKFLLLLGHVEVSLD
jgi:hypothetical protein